MKKWRNFSLQKGLFRNRLDNDLFVSGLHKVIFDEFESGITNTYDQNNNKMNTKLAKVSSINTLNRLVSPTEPINMKARRSLEKMINLSSG